jgi:ketosteroid isomerase-like protein
MSLATWRNPANILNPPEDTMKTSLLLAFVGLAISFALPTYAQQTNTPDPKLRERLISRFKALTDALDKNDAAAVAANFTEDAILVTSYGQSWGRQAIEQWYAELFKEVQATNNLVTIDEDSPHALCTAGNELWATGKWSQTLKGPNGSTEVKGYWTGIADLEGDDWNIRMLCPNAASPLAAIASPTASPSTQ